MKKSVKIIILPKQLDNGQKRYLYVTVSQDVEKIKIGDWYLVKLMGRLRLSSNPATKVDVELQHKHEAYKIICSNDPKLTRSIWEGIPQLPQSFLKEYIANPNGEYEVEYRCQEIQHYNHHLIGNTCTCKKDTLVLNQDNTVNITSKEEKIYSREDLLKVWNAAREVETCDGSYDIMDSLESNRGDLSDPIASHSFDAWITENLKV